MEIRSCCWQSELEAQSVWTHVCKTAIWVSLWNITGFYLVQSVCTACIEIHALLSLNSWWQIIISQAIVFVVGGGNYIEYQNLVDYTKVWLHTFWHVKYATRTLFSYECNDFLLYRPGKGSGFFMAVVSFSMQPSLWNRYDHFPYCINLHEVHFIKNGTFKCNVWNVSYQIKMQIP